MAAPISQRAPPHSVRRTIFEPAPVLVACPNTLSPPPPAPTDYFTSMPLELRRMVYGYLEPREALVFRRFSRQCSEDLRELYITYTFTEVSIKLTEGHLMSLRDALFVDANSAKFAKQVKSLRVYSHIRDTPLRDAQACRLWSLLLLCIAKMPKLSIVVMAGGHDDRAHFVDGTSTLRRNGFNCDLRLLQSVLRCVPNPLVSNFRLEGIASRHNLLSQLLEAGKTYPKIKSLGLSSIAACRIFTDPSIPGTFRQPVRCVNLLTDITTLSYEGSGHMTHSNEMTHLLRKVRLPQLTTLKLSDAAIFQIDVYEFCFQHQNIEHIEFSRVTLLGYRWDQLVFDAIQDIVANSLGNEEDFDLAKLQTIKLNQLCETWGFDDGDDGPEKMHSAVWFCGKVHRMNNSYDGWWKNEVFVVPGRGNPAHPQYFTNYNPHNPTSGDPFIRLGVDIQTGNMQPTGGEDEDEDESEGSGENADGSEHGGESGDDDDNDGDSDASTVTPGKSTSENDIDEGDEEQDTGDEGDEDQNMSGDEETADEEVAERIVTGCSNFYHIYWSGGRYRDATHLHNLTWRDFEQGLGTEENESGDPAVHSPDDDED